MTIRNAVSIITFAAVFGLAGVAQADSGSITFPTMTFQGEFETTTKSQAKSKACKLFCTKTISE